MEKSLEPAYVANPGDRRVVSEQRTSSTTSFNYRETGVGTDLDLEISRIHINDIYNVDTVFALSTAKHAIPVFKIDNILFSENELLNRIQDLYKNLVQSEKANFSNK